MRETKKRWFPGVALGLVALVAGGSGCLHHPGALHAGAPGTTTIFVENHLGSPDELDRLLVTVDEVTVPLAALPPRGEDPTALGSLRLSPGPHTISVHAATRGAGDEKAVVSTQQIFHVAAAPAALDIDLRSGQSALAVELTLRGGHLERAISAGPAPDKDERCAPLLPIPRALCRASSDLDDAGRKSDLVGSLCVRDKLVEMRQLALIGDPAEGRVLALSREIDRCVGAGVVIGRDGTTITHAP